MTPTAPATIEPPAAPNGYAATIAKALGGKPCHDPNAPCQPCARYELQFLVALPSVVAAEHARALGEAGCAWTPSFDKAFTEMPRHATTPVARLARTGYVYLYYADWQTWDVWQVLPNRLARKLLHQVERTQYERHQSALADAPPAGLCSQGAANVPAHLIGIYGARNASHVWMAFSPHLWTGATLQRYADNPEVEIESPHGPPIKTRLRARRGLEVDPRAIVGGQFPAQGALPLNEAALSANLIDYCAAPEGAVGPAWPGPGFAQAFADAPHPLTPERFGQAASFAQRVRQLERALSPANHPRLYENKTLILMLPDPEGVADAHNQLRMQALAARQAWMAGGPDAKGQNKDPDRPWKRQSLLQAGYIREWVKAREKATHQERLDRGLYRTRHIISASEYQQIHDTQRRTGRSMDPTGTTYEKLEGAPERYRVTLPEESVKKGIEGLAAGTARNRIERYDSHLDGAAIQAANQQWLAAEQAWTALLKRRDGDYVHWIRSAALQTALRYDFDDERALRDAQRTPAQVKRDVLEMAARLEANARCFGGGACSDESLKLLVEMFRKDEKNKGHFIAQAMIGEAEALDKFIAAYRESPGVQADMYDAVTASKASWGEFKAAWEQVKERAASASDTLTQVALQVTQRMKEMALLPALAQQRGLVVKLEEAARMQVVWARAAGFAEFVDTGTRQYMVGVRWKAGAFAAASTEQTLGPPAVDARERAITGKQARRARIDTRAELKPFLMKHAGDVDATIMLVVDGKELKAIAHARGEKMIEVVSTGLFGVPQGVVSLPESMALRIVRERHGIDAHNLKNAGTVLNMGVFYLQALAVAESWENIAKKGGLDQVDAVASLLGGISGLAGATSELAALLLTPPVANAAGAPLAAEIASKVPAYLRWKFAAGLFMASGSVFDAVVAFAKALKADAQGDADARTAYGGTGVLQTLGGLSIGVGQYHAYRAAILNRVGAQGAVRLLASSVSPLQLSRCLTGVGLVLWLAGLGLSLYALYLEDDNNEIFMRRSFFGIGHPQLGKFANLDHEVQHFGALAVGTSGELEWHDYLTAADEFTARVKVFNPEPTNVVTMVLEGFDKINGAKVAEIFKGDMPPLKPEKPRKGQDNGPEPDPRWVAAGEVYLTERRMPVPASVKAIRMTYSLYENRAENAWPRTRGEVWIEDSFF